MKDEQTASMFSKVSTEGKVFHQISAKRALMQLDCAGIIHLSTPSLFCALLLHACMHCQLFIRQTDARGCDCQGLAELARKGSLSDACLAAGINFDAYEEVQVWHLHACMHACLIP